MACSNACGTKCTEQDPCVMNKGNLEKLSSMNCALNQLKHKVQCSNTRIKSYKDSPCHQPGDPKVDADEIASLLKSLEETVENLRHEFQEHDKLHQRRVKREGAIPRDSGYISGIPENFPVPEEGVSSSLVPELGSREPSEHNETHM